MPAKSGARRECEETQVSFYLKHSWRTHVIEPLNGGALLLSSHIVFSFRVRKEFVKAPNEKDYYY